MKKIEIRMTERKTNKIGFVVNSLLPKAGGRLKSAVLVDYIGAYRDVDRHRHVQFITGGEYAEIPVRIFSFSDRFAYSLAYAYALFEAVVYGAIDERRCLLRHTE